MHISDALHGCTVLVIHEDAFHGGYLAEVLRAAGALVLGPVPTPAIRAELLAQMHAPAAMVLSQSVHNSGPMLMREAAGRGVVTLIVHPAAPASPVVPHCPRLSGPYAGFQVVEALVALIAAGGGERPAAGPVIHAN